MRPSENFIHSDGEDFNDDFNFTSEMTSVFVSEYEKSGSKEDFNDGVNIASKLA